MNIPVCFKKFLLQAFRFLIAKKSKLTLLLSQLSIYLSTDFFIISNVVEGFSWCCKEIRVIYNLISSFLHRNREVKILPSSCTVEVTQKTFPQKDMATWWEASSINSLYFLSECSHFLLLNKELDFKIWLKP